MATALHAIGGALVLVLHTGRRTIDLLESGLASRLHARNVGIMHRTKLLGLGGAGIVGLAFERVHVAIPLAGQISLYLLSTIEAKSDAFAAGLGLAHVV